MPSPLITVDRLAKAYRIGLREDIPDTFVGALTGWLKAPVRNWQRLRTLNTFHKTIASRSADSDGSLAEETGLSTAVAEDIVWALRDVSFEVHEGEVVGIIGRNGAGKSTLLKVLSKITEPTRGRAVIRGRVSSLLEVGTGFHAELTGRENVYMNGTILGMTKREIDRKFDEIVAFSGVEKFLDTPIKRYSSGMKVRLAFAVAAHLDPEILIIDEVLAVGDAAFQRKCVGKMKDVASGGRTVLFVSHNAGALRTLCNRGIVLEGGRRVFDGSIQDALATYMSSLEPASGHTDLSHVTDRKGQGDVRVTSVEIREDGRLAGSVATGGCVEIRVHLSVPVVAPDCRLRIFDSNGIYVAQCSTRVVSPEDEEPAERTRTIVCRFPEFLLMPNSYFLEVEVLQGGKTQDRISRAADLFVRPGVVRGRPVETHRRQTITTIPHQWSYLAEPSPSEGSYGQPETNASPG